MWSNNIDLRSDHTWAGAYLATHKSPNFWGAPVHSMKRKFIDPLGLTAYKNTYIKWPFPTVDFEQVNFCPLFTKWLQLTAVYIFSGKRCTSSSPCNLSQLSYSESCQSGYIQTDGYPNNYENVVSGWRLLNRNGYTNLTLTFIHFEVIYFHIYVDAYIFAVSSMSGNFVLWWRG